LQVIILPHVLSNMAHNVWSSNVIIRGVTK